MRRALLSVSDKTGLVELGKALVERDFEILSTGGSAAVLREAGIAVTDVSEVTGFPECLSGRVKTLHPRVHAGLLARRDVEEDMDFLQEENIKPIDLVVVNLYPFKKTIMTPGVSLEEAIENIDIGGPTLIRAAAKNAKFVTILSDPADYEDYIRVLDEAKEDSDQIFLGFRTKMQAKAFRHTAYYDSLISNYLSQEAGDMGHTLTLAYDKVQDLRYGENPHQKAAFYQKALPLEDSLSQAEQLQGKELSYNNIMDTNAALEIIKEFTEPTVVGLKHANPCGIGSAATIEEAWELAYEADSVSIYGGIVACNRPINKAMAKSMKKVFLEVVLAPAVDEDAMEILSKKKNMRILRLPDLAKPFREGQEAIRAVYGGILVQDQDRTVLDKNDLKVVTKVQPEEGDLEKIEFAMKAVKHVKSNAVCLTRDFQTVGIGPGQPNRITSVELAVKHAGDKAKGAILASDAFFPFDDCVRYAAEAGIRLIVQPGGSIRDEDSIKACDELGICMIFTGQRHFKH
jgi:phosphoribosylaminoimidazolecarboxamide formyltransferase/IMP cyclohydrolase